MATLDLAAHGAVLEPATKRHARELARIMRAKDRDECSAGGLLPEAAIRMSINNSKESYAAYARGHLLAVFGVGPLHAAPEITVVWAMTSINVDSHPLTFWRCSKVVVSYFRDRYPLMVNMVHGQYSEAFNWLGRLGFQISPPERFGARGDLFCKAILHTPRIEVARV